MSVLTAFPQAVAQARRWVDGGEIAGAEFAVSGLVSGEALVSNVGADERPVRRIYCVIKPLVSLAIVQAAEEGRFTLSDPVARYISSPTPANDATIEQALRHETGVSAPPLRAYSEPMAVFARRIVGAARTSPTAPGVYDTTYWWQALGQVAESTYEAPLDEIIRRYVLEPASSQGEVWTNMPPRYQPLQRPTKEGFVELREPPRARVLGWPNAAHGGFATTRGLAGLFAGLLRHRRATRTSLGRALAEMLKAPREVTMGPRSQQLWGLGVSVDPEHRKFGTGWTAGTFGHYGSVAGRTVTAVWADPGLGSAIAVVLASVDARSSVRMAMLSDLARRDVAAAAVGFTLL